MTVTHKLLAQAKIAFETAPQPATAARFMTLLREAEAEGLIGDDDWLNGLAAINDYLCQGGSVADDPDPDYDDNGNLRAGVDHRN